MRRDRVPLDTLCERGLTFAFALVSGVLFGPTFLSAEVRRRTFPFLPPYARQERDEKLPVGRICKSKRMFFVSLRVRGTTRPHRQVLFFCHLASWPLWFHEFPQHRFDCARRAWPAFFPFAVYQFAFRFYCAIRSQPSAMLSFPCALNR